MNPSTLNSEFLKSFSNIIADAQIDGENVKTRLNLFIHNINSNEFDYESLKGRLVDPLIDFALSRKTKEKLKNKPGTLSKQAREKFVKNMNTGELGEFLLYCFLETHLHAPKVLSKLELKTSTNNYVNGSDGVHFLKLDNGNFQLLFGESKTIKVLSTAIADAFQSIYDFKNEINSKGNDKSGLPYEKTLISEHIESEAFTDEEKEFIETLIYPDSNNNYSVDDAFGIFIGYEVNVTDEERKLSNEEFRKLIHSRIQTEVENQYQNILDKLNVHKLTGHNFYLYILPFTNLEETREEITKAIIS